MDPSVQNPSVRSPGVVDAFVVADPTAGNQGGDRRMGRCFWLNPTPWKGLDPREEVVSMNAGLHESPQVGDSSERPVASVGNGAPTPTVPSFKDKLLGDKGNLPTAQYISELDVEVGADDVRLGGKLWWRWSSGKCKGCGWTYKGSE
ncbi:hypothetical protein V6N13_083062 [Hibiscus sabdariffa]